MNEVNDWSQRVQWYDRNRQMKIDNHVEDPNEMINQSTNNTSLGAQSFTSLKADLHQDINRGLAFGALKEHFL